MNLTKKEAMVLGHLTGKKSSYDEIAKALHIQKPNLAKYAKKLEKCQLIAAERKNKRKVLSINHSVWIGYMGARKKFPQIKMEDIIAGKMPFMISVMGTGDLFKLKDFDLPAITAKRLLKKLRMLGIAFMPKRGIYQLREDSKALAAYCKEIIIHMFTAEAGLELKGIRQEYFSFNSPKEPEIIFVTSQENSTKHYWPTAYSMFGKYKLDIITAGKYYYSNIKPNLNDIIIHSLAVNSDERGIMYAAALIIKNKLDPNGLLKKKQRFGINEDIIKNMIKLIKTKGKIKAEGLPSWDEIRETAYG